jgi:hypothetical protein
MVAASRNQIKTRCLNEMAGFVFGNTSIGKLAMQDIPGT